MSKFQEIIDILEFATNPVERIDLVNVHCLTADERKELEDRLTDIYMKYMRAAIVVRNYAILFR